MKINEYTDKLLKGEFDSKLAELYTENCVEKQRKRYTDALRAFSEAFPERDDIHVYSAPGRTEIGGNHTDHQHGCVLAAAVNLDTIAVTSFHNDGVIRINSEGYKPFEVYLNSLEVQSGEKSSSAIVRGIVSRFSELCSIGGFDMYLTSDVLSGSGISSSAAFENVISTAIDLYCNNGRAGDVEIAKTGQYAENVYFGKNCGLMDQLVSSVGGFVLIDFENTDNPVIEKISYDFGKTGYRLIITNTGGSHSDLSDEYSDVRTEMESVAAFFGKKVLREVEEEIFFGSISELRKDVSDRAVLRAVHFFNDSRNAVEEAGCLKRGDFKGFLELIRKSGQSSENYLQNLFSVKKPLNQEIPLGIMTARRVLGENAAVRVHGGGFAGTIQAFVPVEKTEMYINAMDSLFGENSCYILTVRPVGGTEL